MTPGLRAGACLSLSGQFAQFGSQAANGLRLWADEHGIVLRIVDDQGERPVLEERLRALAPTVDLLFGPYSTKLIRAAIPIAAESGSLLFNHGGSGGQLNYPGQVVNTLTPARRYAEPFITHLVATGESGPLLTAAGRGRFGRDVVDGASAAANATGIEVARLDFDRPPTGRWSLFSAGVYEDDVATVRAARSLPNPPRMVCSVAAGVAAFANDVGDPAGVFGIGQWAPGANPEVNAGMDEEHFLAAWERRFGGVPDYPAVQAYATGVVAAAAARASGTVRPDLLWSAAAGLDVTTVFGAFRLDAATGEQIGHVAALTCWRSGTSVNVTPRR